MYLDMLQVIGFKGPILGLMKMDQNGHDCTWAQLPLPCTLPPGYKLVGFPMGCELLPKIIDRTKQLE
jgi:hypothetical protein